MPARQRARVPCRKKQFRQECSMPMHPISLARPAAACIAGSGRATEVPKRVPADAFTETSARYHGWRVVLACFVMAVFSWGFGFYGQGVYLAELQRLTGWPTSLIAGASTAYYLLSAVLVAFVSDCVARLGPRRFLLAGTACLALATAGVGLVTAPWQLFLVYLLMAFGWAS